MNARFQNHRHIVGAETIPENLTPHVFNASVSIKN